MCNTNQQFYTFESLNFYPNRETHSLVSNIKELINLKLLSPVKLKQGFLNWLFYHKP